MTTPVLQWKRVCEVETRGPSGAALLIKNLRVQFEVVKTNGKTPNVAKILIYNLAQENENRIRGEFDEVSLRAGYEGAPLMIFRGNIRRVFRYREENDHITHIDAADGDKAFRNATVNATFAAGTSTLAIVDHLISLCPGTIRGTIDIQDKKLPRGRTLCGMVRDKLESIARDNGAHWSIQDGAHNIVPVGTTLPLEAIVINANTGMLGAPEVSDKGIKVACLLNPAIRIDGKVWLDNNGIKGRIAREREKKPTTGQGKPRATTTKPKAGLARLDPDGIYKPIHLTHRGDTRDREFKTEIMCVGLDKAIPPGKVAA